MLQAEDRAHRIGQVNTVTVTYFLAAGSVDALLWPMVRQKMKLLGKRTVSVPMTAIAYILSYW